VYTDKIRNLPGAYGFENADDVVPTKDLLYSIGDFAPHQPSISELPIPSANPVFYTEIDFDYNSGQDLDVSHLDHWVVSYPKGIPSLKDTEGNDLAQDRIALPNLYSPMVWLIRVPDGMNRVVFDISDPDHPKYYMMQPDGKDSFFYITAGVDTPQLAVMNPLKKQLDVRTVTLGDTEIQNQDLHALAYEGADLIIVTIPALRQAAERLADLHRQYMNQRVIVATTQECYNEFSNGMPDPQGIRSLVKMVHTSDYGCKNLLLMGPLYSDFRGITLDKNPLEGIIAFQSLSTNSERGGFNANDFYGMMTEHIGDTRLEELPMDVGVGILPIRHAAEADIYVAKVEKYITRGDFAYYLNHIVTFGGVGDEDLHSSQVPELDRYISNVGERSLINSQILVDAYGYREAHDKLLRHADEGALLFTYFGHGNTCMLNLTGDFFRASDVYAFSNDFHPFWGFAGCELTVPDKGIRGMGESVVVSTPHGMIGTLLATRDTWSSMNFDLFKKFFSNFLRDGGVSSSKFHKDALTIGEIYARTKSQSKYSNELAYQLVCDPAIVIPQVNRRIILDEESLTAKSGNWLELKGHVAEYDTDEPDSDYNGEVVVRLMAPEVEMACPHLVGKSDKSVGLPKDDIVVTYGDTRLAMGAAEVKDGRFSLRIMIPASAQDFDGERGPLYLAAYDPASRMGAASRFHTVFESAGAEESVLSADTQAPVIERFEYLPESKTICVTVSDDTALAFEISNFYDPFRLVIDGKELRAGASNRPVIDYDSDSYTKTISVNNVSYGPHSAKVIVKDAAGNE
ncbi:MAG: hypothetical protein K2K29_04840, partial [Muribaculaceae bacterium]|nr:hypothetical protein [Muribaculaceae bacterium]